MNPKEGTVRLMHCKTTTFSSTIVLMRDEEHCIPKNKDNFYPDEEVSSQKSVNYNNKNETRRP